MNPLKTPPISDGEMTVSQGPVPVPTGVLIAFLTYDTGGQLPGKADIEFSRKILLQQNTHTSGKRD